MGLISELQRRNVFRVAVAYLAAAWLVLQVAETLLPAYGFGDGAIRTLIALLGIGLAAALIFAWVFELTPEGLKLESDVDRSLSITRQTGKKLDRVIILVLSIALLYFAFDKFVLGDIRIESARQEGRAEALIERHGDKSIAVLPFADMSVHGDQEYMSDGIAEELLNLLTRIPELRVISRSSAFSYKDKAVSVPEIASKLNVAYILEGSVRKANNKIRVTTQLLDARADAHIWSQTYDRELGDVFSIQDEIAKSVVDQLEVAILGDTPRVRQTDPEAYALFLQARYLHEQPAGDSFLRAFDYYKAALEIDQNYVPAWVWLAALYDDTINSSGLPYEEVGRLAHEAIDTALRIDPDDPMALGMSALLLADWDGDIKTAALRMKRALELDPSNAILLRWAANLSPSFGLYEQAVQINEYLYERDPVGNIARINLAGSYINAGRFQDGIELCEIHLAVNANDSPCRYRITIGYLQSGDATAALEHMNLLESETGRLRLAPMVFFALGKPEWRDKLGELLRRYESGEKRWASQIARIHAYTGEIDAAFAWIERARTEGMLDVAPNSIHFRNLQGDPRWSALMTELGLTPDAIEEIGFTVRIPE